MVVVDADEGISWVTFYSAVDDLIATDFAADSPKFMYFNFVDSRVGFGWAAKTAVAADYDHKPFNLFVLAIEFGKLFGEGLSDLCYWAEPFESIAAHWKLEELSFLKIYS